MWFTWNRLKDAYIPVSFKQLQPSDSLACPLFLLVTERCETADYREQMIPLRNVAEPLSAPEIESLKLSGVTHLWIRKTDKQVFLRNLGADWITLAQGSLLSFSPSVIENISDESAFQYLYKKLPEQMSSLAEDHCFALIEKRSFPKILASLRRTYPNFEEFFSLLRTQPEASHGYRVAILSTSLINCVTNTQEHQSPALISELALAALFHDIGVSQLNRESATTPWKRLLGPHQDNYRKHVEYSLKLLGALAPDLPNRTKQWIWSHHEKFDGSGYPGKKSGFDIDQWAQLLNLCNLIDNLITGRWDGITRNFNSAIQTLKVIEQTPKVPPEYLAPRFTLGFLSWIGQNT